MERVVGKTVKTLVEATDDYRAALRTHRALEAALRDTDPQAAQAKAAALSLDHATCYDARMTGSAQHILAGLAFALLAGACKEKPLPPELTKEHREIVAEVISKAKRTLPSPQAWELSSLEIDPEILYLVATIKFNGNPTPTRAMAKQIGTVLVLEIRNALNPYGVADDYRVSLNGPEPGAGLVLRYGSARMSRNRTGGITWKDGV